MTQSPTACEDFYSIPFNLPSTPYSNTGSVRQTPQDTGIEVAPDYLVVTGLGYIEDIMDSVEACFGAVFSIADAKSGHRGKHYDMIIQSPLGIEIAYCHANSDDLYDIRLSVPGSPLANCRPGRRWEFFRFLRDRNFIATRFDFRIDDTLRILPLGSIADCAIAGDYSGARATSEITSREQGKCPVGRTIYFGSRLSDKLVRFYDKSVESKGTINSIRMEVQWRGARADSVFRLFSDAESALEAETMLSEYCLGAIKFVYRADSEVLSRCRIYDFWQEFCDRVGKPRKMAPLRVQPLLSAKIRWIEKSVSGTLAAIAQCKGIKWLEDWLHRVTSEALGKANPTRTAFVATWKRRQAIEKDTFSAVYDRLKTAIIGVDTTEEEVKSWQEALPTERIPVMLESPTQSKLTNPTPTAPCLAVQGYSCQLELPISLPYPRGWGFDTL